MTEGHGLEFQPVPEFGHSCLAAQDKVFMAHSMHPLTIYSRLIRGKHTREKRLRVVLISDGLRTFVHAEVIAYPMPGSMSEITFCLPQRHTRKGIQLTTGRSPREHRHRQIYHSLEDQSIILLLKERAIAHRDRACNICRTCKILSAGIRKIEPVLLYDRRIMPRSRIMRKRCRRSVS